MKANSFFALLLFSCFSSHAQITLRSGESWVYTFPTTTSFTHVGSGPYEYRPTYQTMSFSIEPGSFETNTELKYEIVAGGKYVNDPMADWQIGAVASGVLTSAPSRSVSLSYSGVAWLYMFSPGGIRFSALAGSVVITNVTLSATITHPGSPGSTSSHRLSFAPQPAPWFNVVRVGPQRVQVAFSTNSSGYTLERTTVVPTMWPRNWTPVIKNYASASDPEFAVDIELTNRIEFLRLRRK